MKSLIINIISVIAIILLVVLSVTQCSTNKQQAKELSVAIIDKQQAQKDYIELMKAKQKVDTFYKEGKPVTKHDTAFIKDTAWIENGKEYGKFAWAIDSADLKFKATITASDLRAVDYTYWVREKVINTQTIVYQHDTLVNTVYRRSLNALWAAGLHAYSLGLQYQTKNRIGFIARHTWFKDEKYWEAGVSVRIF